MALFELVGLISTLSFFALVDALGLKWRKAIQHVH